VKALLLPNVVGFPSTSIERYARELLSGLKAVAGPDWSVDELRHEGPRLLPGKGGEKWASRAGRFITYPLTASRTEADVYHVLDHSHANLTLALPPEKTVITCHDVIPFLAATGRIPMATGRLTRYTFPQRVRCMRRCRAILCDSDATARDLHEFFGVPTEQTATVYLGRNPLFTPEPPGGAAERVARTAEIRKKHGIPEEAFVVFHVGTPMRYKNTPALLRALPLLRDALKGRGDVYLLRASAPLFPDEEELARELGVADRVIQAGRLPTDEDLAAYYRASDVFAFPSLYEGFGWPPLEAMSCGVPVVTSNAASLPEVVGDAGLTVPPTDHAALADALYRVLTDDALRQSLKAKLPAQAAKFTWENCARRTLEVYGKVVGRRS
jgi:glycosyltransferase involved in cell wall biosynthesis